VHDVARVAGVSIATVSRVLNGTGKVHPDLIKQVNEAAAQLGYMASSVGKALRLQKNRVIGTIIPSISDAVFSEIAGGVQDTLVANNYVGFIQTGGFDNSKLYQHAMRMIEKGAEGILILGRIEDENLLKFQQETGFPLLSIYSYLSDSAVPSIGFDNYFATNKLLKLMAQLGHKRIAMIAGKQAGNDRQQNRIKAFEDFQTDRGETPIIEEIDFSFERAAAAAALREIVKKHPDVTSIVCTRDEIAFCVLAECRRMGISVPGQISIAGFDDISFASYFHPSLTTVAFSGRDIAEQAARMMINHLENGEPLRSRILDTEVILRESTAIARSE